MICLMNQKKEVLKSIFNYNPVPALERGKGGKNGYRHNF